MIELRPDDLLRRGGVLGGEEVDDAFHAVVQGEIAARHRRKRMVWRVDHKPVAGWNGDLAAVACLVAPLRRRCTMSERETVQRHVPFAARSLTNCAVRSHATHPRGARTNPGPVRWRDE